MPFLRLAFLYIMHQSFVTTAPESLGMDIFMVTVIPKALPNSWQVNVKLLSLVRAWNQKPHRSTALQEQRLAQNMALKLRYVNAIPRSICSLCEISWSVPGHLSDTLKFSAGQNKNLLDRHKKNMFVYINICLLRRLQDICQTGWKYLPVKMKIWCFCQTVRQFSCRS